MRRDELAVAPGPPLTRCWGQEPGVAAARPVLPIGRRDRHDPRPHHHRHLRLHPSPVLLVRRRRRRPRAGEECWAEAGASAHARRCSRRPGWRSGREWLWVSSSTVPTCLATPCGTFSTPGYAAGSAASVHRRHGRNGCGARVRTAPRTTVSLSASLPLFKRRSRQVRRPPRLRVNNGKSNMTTARIAFRAVSESSLRRWSLRRTM